LAKALNALLPAGKKFSGGLVPCTDSMKAWLSKQGGRLSESDVTHVASFRNEASTILVDLTQLDEEDGAPIGADALDAAMQVEWPRFAQDQDSQQAAEHGYLVKNAMQRVIAPEVEALIKVSPETLLRWRIHGIDIVLAADGTAIVRFTSRSFKLETGACKIIAPHAEGPQQAASMGIPLFVHDGEECYAGLQATLGRMIQDGHLTKAVRIIVEGEQVNLSVRWHLCADLKLVNLASGLGSASSARPCFLCFWARNDPLQQAEARTEGHMGERAEWAMEFLQPVRAAEAALAEARQAVKSHEEECKRRLQGAHDPKGYESRLVELQGAVAAQLEDRARIVQDVLQKVAALPLAHPMIIIWQDPAWLQQQSFTVPLIHFKDRSKESAAGHLFSEVQSVWQHVEQCARGVAQATVELQKARDTLAAATDWQQQTPWYKQVEDAVETKEGLLEKALL
jgi:hypothetical protein